MRRILFCTMLLVLAGCATAAQRQAMKIHNVQQEAGTGLKTCVAEVYHRPEYETISSHLSSPDNGFQPTMAQLADDTRPTKEEAKLLIKYHDDMLPCRQSFLEKIQSVTPTIAQVITEDIVEGDKLMMQLVKRKITWGEAARQKQQLVVGLQKKVINAAQQIDSSLATSHQAEMAQRQAASNALMQWSLQQQMINSMNRPTVTTCNENGPFVNCVSQ